MSRALDKARLGSTSPFNYVINGGMRVSQQNGQTPVTGTTGYPVDMFRVDWSMANGYLFSNQLSSKTPGGSLTRLKVTCQTAFPTVGVNDVAYIIHRIEGARFAPSRWGLTTAKTMVLRFGVKAPAGSYSVSVSNEAANRSFIAEYTISASEANTDVLRTVIIPGDITGTWTTSSTFGLQIVWSLTTGTNYRRASGSWIDGNFVAGNNQTNFLTAPGNTFELFDVGLYEGRVAPSFEMPGQANELMDCYRYFFRLTEEVGGMNRSDGDAATQVIVWLPATMRAVPTFGGFSFAGGSTPAVVRGSARFLWLQGSIAGDYLLALTANARI